MTDEELAAIKARAEAATPGPWARDMGHISTVCSLGPDGRVLAKFAHFHRNGSWESTVQDDENAAFIAHAREDIPALLAEVEAWREVGQMLINIPKVPGQDYNPYAPLLRVIAEHLGQ